MVSDGKGGRRQSEFGGLASAATEQCNWRSGRVPRRHVVTEKMSIDRGELRNRLTTARGWRCLLAFGEGSIPVAGRLRRVEKWAPWASAKPVAGSDAEGKARARWICSVSSATAVMAIGFLVN